MNYTDFLKSKTIADVPTGFEVDPDKLCSKLFPFQRAIVVWALKRGRAGIFSECGTGKSLMFLAWANEIVKKTGKNVLILSPLFVAHQTVSEGKKFKIPINYCRNEVDAQPGITITNYECFEHFHMSHFVGVVLDESAILKSFEGKFRKAVTESCANMPYRLSCSATPAPNDYVELAMQAEFLGVMSRVEMLCTFFWHDATFTKDWHLKGHAEEDFWRWMASWSVMIRKPSDIGFSDKGYVLPELEIKQHILPSNDKPTPGFLFAMPQGGLAAQRAIKRESIEERCELVAKIAKNTTGQVVISCELNDEGDKLEEMIGRSLQITGSDTPAFKEQAIIDFIEGKRRVMLSKGRMISFGLNLQMVKTAIVSSISHSHEMLYQFIRRFHRFGQKDKVTIHQILMESEISVLQNLERKQKDADVMSVKMIAHMREAMEGNIKGLQRETIEYVPKERMVLPAWL